MTEEQARFAHHFHCFARNGRWGTCGDCPCDREGGVHPEFCANTLRYDHQLDVKSLVEQWEQRG